MEDLKTLMQDSDDNNSKVNYVTKELFKTIALVIFSIAIVFISKLLTTGGSLDEIAGTLSLSGISLFTFATWLVGIMITSEALNFAIKKVRKDKEDEFVILEKDNSDLYNSLDIDLGIDRTEIYNNEMRKALRKQKYKIVVSNLKHKSAKYNKDNKKYIKIRKKINEIAEDDMRIKYKNIQFGQLLHNQSSNGFVDGKNINENSKSKYLTKSGTKSLIVKVFLSVILTATGYLLLNGDIVEAIIITIVYGALYTYTSVADFTNFQDIYYKSKKSELINKNKVLQHIVDMKVEVEEAEKYITSEQLEEIFIECSE